MFNIEKFPRKRGIGRLCAKAPACLAMGGVTLLLISFMILHAWRRLHLQASTVRCATPADIAALFGPERR